MLLPVILMLSLTVLARVEAATLESRAGQVAIKSGWLNVRNTPSSTGSKVATLSGGTIVTLLEQKGQWWYIEYEKGKYGYCHGDYIKAVAGNASQVSIQSGYLNVRSGPGTGYGRTASLGKGEVVVELSASAGWTRILFHGSKTGYVSSSYLSSRYYRGVSLAVPDLKQMDSRWAQETIDSSGKTFAQIGCATTAIAIVESHRRGTTVLPNKISKELRYTLSGNVYWPGDYVPVTTQAGYLEQIYKLLQQGKVVLLGMRNSYGQQHWVVVTGFAGGSTLDPVLFTIRDPGSNYRKNLQQFFDAYPNFYKYFRY